ncbi:MAG: DsbA family protein [Bradyrhizobium sp.]|jgi:protein-disulfide isomerase
MPTLRLLLPALFALALCATPPAASAQSFSDGQRGEIETIIRSYLVAHPEVLEEAMAELNKRQAAAEAEKHEASVATNANTIFNSPRGVVLGNKDGDVTFVEFFDYNCGYCKRAMADMLELMKTDPKLKVVLKEFPVLSEGSVEAAKVAVAVRMQDPSGKKYLDFHQRLLGGRGPADKARAMAAAKEAGLDTARIEKDLASPEVRATIEENFKLAESMGMNGTPSYVIGKQVVVGAVGLDTLREKIGVARCGKATC